MAEQHSPARPPRRRPPRQAEAHEQAALREQQLAEEIVRGGLRFAASADRNRDGIVTGSELSQTMQAARAALPQHMQVQLEGPASAQMTATGLNAIRNPTPEEARVMGAEMAGAMKQAMGLDAQATERMGGRIAAALLNGSVRAEQDALPRPADFSDISSPRGLPEGGLPRPSGRTPWR